MPCGQSENSQENTVEKLLSTATFSPQVYIILSLTICYLLQLRMVPDEEIDCIAPLSGPTCHHERRVEKTTLRKYANLHIIS